MYDCEPLFGSYQEDEEERKWAHYLEEVLQLPTKWYSGLRVKVGHSGRVGDDGSWWVGYGDWVSG